MLYNILITLEAIFFIYTAYLAGSVLLDLLNFSANTKTGKIAYAITAGLGLASLAGLALAVLGIFNGGFLWLILLAVIALSAPKISSHIFLIRNNLRPTILHGRIREFFRNYPALKIIVIVWLIANFFIVFVPLTGHDTLDYHLPIIEHIIDFKTLPATQNVNSFFLPISGEILYAIPTALFGNQSFPYVFQLLQYGFLILLVSIIFDFTSKLVTKKYLAVAAALSVLAIMDLQREALHGGYVDLLAFLFGTASVFLVIDHCETEEKKAGLLSLSAVFLGFALGVKYLALFFGAANAIFLIIDGVQNRTLKKTALSLLRYGLIAAAVGGFWYAKNLVMFGNPVYPMFTSKETTSQVNMFIMERTLPNFLAFPFFRYGQWFIQKVESSSRLIVLLYFSLAYVLAGVSLLIWRKIRKPELFLLLFMELYLALVFLTSHQYRFIIPATLIAPLIIILISDRLFDKALEKMGPRAQSKIAKMAVVVIALAFSFIFLANLRYFYAKWYYVLGGYTQKEYVGEIGGQ